MRMRWRIYVAREPLRYVDKSFLTPINLIKILDDISLEATLLLWRIF